MINEELDWGVGASAQFGPFGDQLKVAGTRAGSHPE
jgi:hypothetical protein